LKVVEVSCRHALVPSSLPGLDFALNPYRGCSHGCVYCYAPSVLRETREWGTFVDVRGDMPAILNRDLRSKREGVVGIGTVTDGYQPIEARYHLTRACLTRLLMSPLRVSVQTKSSLVLRDLDLLSEFKEIDVGVTVTTLDEYVSRAVEPLAAPPRKRLETMRALADQGMEVWAFVGPYLPGLRGKAMENLVRELSEAGATRILGDRLRIRSGTMERMRMAAMQLLPDERTPFLTDLEDPSYASTVEIELRQNCDELGVEYRPAFPSEAEAGRNEKKAFSF